MVADTLGAAQQPYPERRIQRNATNSSRFAGFGQRFTQLTLPRKTANESADEVRGPLGLNVLENPKDPFVEFIFVHGLRGGSRKTWTCDDDPATFWPMWLPDDKHRRFAHVRIHIYGYNADWADRRTSVSNVNDFGLQLLESLVNGPYLTRDVNNPIVFIAHSLGGLVVKKAFNLAKQDPKHYDVSRRFHTLFFLATPHRGADSATMLNNILRASMTNSPRAFISDLEPNSAAIEGINESFRHNYHGTRIWSFYETVPSFPNTNDLVVEKHSSTLGFAEERLVPLNTDHLGACRFASSSDPAYMLISDALASTVKEILEELLDPEMIRDQMRILADYLGVSEAEDEELSNLEDAEVSGSCQWLLEKQSFIDWRDAQGDGDPTEIDLPARTRNLAISKRNRLDHPLTPRFFWLTGAPGTGKSVLAAHVIRHLENRDCSFYFLKHSDRSKQNLSGLLKSIAYQMARRDVALRQSLLSMQKEGGLTAEKNDIRAIWKQLFVQKIFRTDFQQRQYWVIDALDEGHGGHELVPLLAKIPEQLPISVFLTSRRDLQLERLLNRLPVVTEQIEISNTLGDIRLYLEEHVDDLPVQDPVAVQDLIEKLLDKSKGSFLWVRLIVQQLETSWSDTAIDEVLENVPEGMEELYSTILEDMAWSSNRALAKAILEWVICAARPLTTAELQEAIRLHIGQKVFKMEDMIEAVCGQLVTVDKQGRVQLVHDTARDFLLDKSLDSVFAIDKARTHEHLADICLRYLISEDTKGPPGRRPLHPSSEVVVPAFQEYANLHFSDHVVKSPSIAADNSLSSLEVFLETTVLSWIEYIARSGDLSPLTQTAKNLKGYVERRVDFQCPLNPEMQIVQDWAVDLIRVVTVFGRHLLSDPSAIHRTIPALCPQSSMLFRKFMNPTLGLEVVGLSMRGWADRIHSTSYSHNATTVACCEKRYAVGLRTGLVVLYYASTCQEALQLNSGETVKQLEFAHAKEWLVVSGKSTMSMWNYKTGLCIWRNDISGEPMSLTITEDDSTIIAATKCNHLISWDTAGGVVLEQDSWHGEENAKHRPPQHVYVSSELNLLALVYRNKPIALFDLGDLTRPRYAGVEDKASVEALAFNPALNQLAVAFFHGEVCTIGIWNLQKITSTLVDASHLAASTDGKTLIVGTNLGSIQIHDFETLKVLYTIRYDDDEITSMIFTGNGLRFLDIRVKEFNVWEPSALVRRKDNDDSTSEGKTSFNTAPSQLVQAYTGNDENMITTMTSHHLGDFVFVGKESGVVAIYETARGKCVRELYNHVKTAVTFMEWNSAQEMLVSSDTSSRILVHRVRPVQTRSSTGTRSTWQTHRVLEKRLGEASEAIRQILLSVDGRYLLVSTSTVDHLWSLDGTSVLTLDHTQPNRIHTPSQKWLTHPRHKRQVFEVDKRRVRIIEWEKHHDSQPSMKSIEADSKERIDFELQGIGIHFVRFGEDSWAAYDNNPSTRPVIWPAPPSSLSASAAAAAALAYFNTVVPVMKNILGMFRSQLVFLDLEGWICSMRLDEAGQERPHTRHFPIPHCWQSTIRGLASIVTVKGDVIVANKHELAIVKRGLSL